VLIRVSFKSVLIRDEKRAKRANLLMGKQEDAKFIGEILVEAGLITESDLKAALEKQRQSERFICSILAESGAAKEENILAYLSSKLGIPYIKIKERQIPQYLFNKMPMRFAVHYKTIPLELKGDLLTVAMFNPLDIHILDDLRSLLGLEVKAVLVSEKDIEEAISKYYGLGAETLDKIAQPGQSQEEPAQAKVEDLSIDNGASIITFVNQILSEAIKEKATDIHFEPYEDGLNVRNRIDGVLYDMSVPEAINKIYPLIVSRIKIMANLDITERRLPQDGRIKIKLGNDELDLRISIMPTIFGESVHIRILSPYFFLELDNLGLMPDDLKLIEEMLKKPHGIILVTGPTGSGKSTTLYACLSKINLPGVKIITIEDPVEYQLKGITQLQVSPKIGFTFSQGLRHMLRHDPDVMMVGEIRDYETAEIAIRAALTGHLVFATLHTNDAAGAVTRLMDMGIEPYLLASSLECLIAQRLVRLICPNCKEKFIPKKETLEGLKDFKTMGSDFEFYQGKGCQECRFTGYKDRTAIYEIIRVTDTLREMIMNRSSSQQIKQRAILEGMRTLAQDGFQKVLAGKTTIAEVLRVTREEGI